MSKKVRYYNNNYAFRVFLAGRVIMDYKIALIPGDGIGPEIVEKQRKYWTKYARNMDILFLFRSSVRRSIH